ncbi:hypothetical protein GPJ56_002997 [Histomonas meleagridis]|uniref:uncharacterized protein n=1 Tax=Histomonas meleagridis TaxID=135588 RepID=UPI00355A7759|nr:hypothetical protein GPJ56_002997 [Histomonas meleagridis]KAH0796654.1 hypothetical protein GO595_010547 [Histomonas meleagridis]
MFEYALNVTEENHQISSKCFTLLTTNNDDLAEAILKENAKAIHENLQIILINKDPIKINRIAMIIQTVITQIKQVSNEDDYSYVLALLPFVYNRSVYDLFVSILSNDTNQPYANLQEYLKYNNFTPTIINIINQNPEDLAIYDQFLLFTNLFKLIPYITQSSLLKDTVTDKEVDSMFRVFTDSSVSLLTSQYSAIFSSITGIQICETASSHFEQLLSVISELPQRPFMPYDEQIIFIIAKLAQHVPTVVERLIADNFCARLVSLAHAFPQHSNLHLAIISFHKETREIEQLRVGFINEFIPFVNEMILSEYVELRSFAWNIMVSLKEEENNIEERLCDESKQKLLSICECVDRSYGGEIPTQAEMEDIELTQEQLQLFLQFLSGGSR